MVKTKLDINGEKGSASCSLIATWCLGIHISNLRYKSSYLGFSWFSLTIYNRDKQQDRTSKQTTPFLSTCKPSVSVS
jgi:hypothetical protein